MLALHWPHVSSRLLGPDENGNFSVHWCSGTVGPRHLVARRTWALGRIHNMHEGAKHRKGSGGYNKRKKKDSQSQLPKLRLLLLPTGSHNSKSTTRLHQQCDITCHMGTQL